MSDYLIIFDDQFNALEFMDQIDINDISDHFSIEKYKVFINGSHSAIPHESYSIIPYAVVISSDEHKYHDLVIAYKGTTVTNFSYD